MSGGVLNRAARFIGELTEVNFESVRRSAEHVDIGAGAEDARLKTGDHDDLDFRVLEAQTLHGIGQFDVDAQVIGIEFELVAFGEVSSS